ncbi:cysteinyl-tRNA synthetase [Entomoplasma freundtii]|uniref:Cysteine--tRNA ligase n=1 Tax=Entomoplasma freundtii TaxID=74700 RepID=A0A2K8NS85_9MOLU|nr:cysteine--tRNA ligase [Entomoplasma freundtii]ATZ16700.1 cysteinyl-tRNA synthetase [Entomoplasma freundtii]TDY58133.1 cysteinyl-tRNA synthetase [Entomoplasma freundtii]
MSFKKTTQLKIYDSLSTQNQTLSLSPSQPIKIYLCGPTVYNYIHLGNARPIITMDFLHRFLKTQNYPVNFLQNITDIDDKIIQKAAQEKQTEKEITDFYIQAYQNDLKNMKVLPPTTTLPISENLPQMIHFIDELVTQGEAYVVDGNVYFHLTPWKETYGQLGKKNLDDLIAGERVETVTSKKNPLDFVLWKKTTEGQKWPSPWGEGRPGWHTECVVLVNDYFKGPVDIHAGGVDLKFPHHENERVQFQAKNNQELAKIWMHNGHLNWGSTKMSKSLGNVVLVKDFFLKHHPDVLKWIFMSAKYTQPLNLSNDLISQGEKFRQKIQNLQKKKLKLEILSSELVSIRPNERDLRLEPTSGIWEEFIEAMQDDLNTPKVLTILERAIKLLNQGLDQGKSWKELSPLSTDFEKILITLGFDDYFQTKITRADKKLYQAWQVALAKKDYPQADSLRKLLIEKDLI